MDLLNKVMVVGNLTRDPEVRETANGKLVADMSLAIDQGGGGATSRNGDRAGDRDGDRDGDRGGNAPEPIFLEVVLWERMAENASQYLKKGSAVLIEGRLQMDSWQDRESGKTRRKLKVCAERMRFLNLGGNRDRDRDREQGGEQGGGHQSRRREAAEARR